MIYIAIVIFDVLFIEIADTTLLFCFIRYKYKYKYKYKYSFSTTTGTLLSIPTPSPVTRRAMIDDHHASQITHYYWCCRPYLIR